MFRVFDKSRCLEYLEAKNLAIVAKINDDSGADFITVADWVTAKRDHHRVGFAIIGNSHGTSPLRYRVILVVL
jgi:hypothetical protein